MTHICPMKSCCIMSQLGVGTYALTNATERLWRWWIDNCLHMINNVFLTVSESSVASWCHGRHAFGALVYYSDHLTLMAMTQGDTFVGLCNIFPRLIFWRMRGKSAALFVRITFRRHSSFLLVGNLCVPASREKSRKCLFLYEEMMKRSSLSRDVQRWKLLSPLFQVKK